MTNKRREFDLGVKLKETTSATTEQGEIRVDSADDKLKAHLDGSERSVVTENQSQTLTNKTLDADNNTVSNLEVDNLKSGVLDTDLSAVSGAHDTIPSAKATKDYVDSQVATVNQASEISYSNGSSGLAATFVQGAIDEVEARLDTEETKSGNFTTLSGVAANSTHLGTFTGTTISDNRTNKQALQDLETALETTDGLIDGHLDGGANKHDATEVDYERVDGSKKNISGSSDDVESAITNLDDAIGALDATPTNYTATNPAIVADHLAGIDAALATSGTTSFSDADFEVKDNGDATKKVKLEVSGVTTATTRTLTVPNANTTIVGTDVAQVITAKDIDGGTASNTSRLTIPKAAKATLDGLTRKQATLVYASDTDKAYFDNGSALIEVGSGSGGWTGKVNYEADGDMDRLLDVTSFTVTGGTRALTSTAGEFGRGVQGLKWTPGASAQTLTKSNFTLPVGYRKYGRISFNGTIKCASNVTLILRDVTNSVDIINQTITTPTEFTKFEYTGTHASTTATLYWQILSTSTNVIYIDDVYVGPDLSINTTNLTNMTDWVQFTPTFTNFTLGNGILDAFKRRVGDSMQISLAITWGSTTSITGALEITVPDGLLIDENKADLQSSVGHAWFRDASNSANDRAGYVLFVNTSKVRIGTPPGSTVGPTQPFTWTTSDDLKSMYTLPIQGWSATSEHVVTNSDSVAPVKYANTDGAAFATATLQTVKFATKQYDNDALYNTSTGLYTVPRSGVYHMSANILFDISAAWVEGETAELWVGKNGSSAYRLDWYQFEDAATKYVSLQGTTTINAVKGDTLHFMARQSSGVTLNIVTSSTATQCDIYPIDRTPLIGISPEPNMIRLNTANGHGSTNTKIRRFTNVTSTVGSYITYADSATLGASLTINKSGNYAISYHDSASNAGTSFVGISLNTTQGTTDITGITIADRLAIAGTNTGAFQLIETSWTGYLSSGSVIRPHTNGFATWDNNTSFTITYLG